MSTRISRSVATLIAITGLTFLDVGVAAQDAKGCQDHPLFTRMPDFVITRCTSDEFAPFEFDVMRDGRLEKSRVEGRRTVINYHLKAGATRPGALKVVENHANAIKAIGGAVLRQQTTVATLRLVKNGTETWAKVASNQLGDGYGLTIVEKAAMAQEVRADASSMARAVDEGGRVAVYGIYFDFNKSEIKPESKPTLDEIAKLLALQPGLRLWVVGHTDNVGEIDYNLSLSRARAEAVAKALVEGFKVGAERLKPYGVGPLSPVTTNKTEEGRAKNRRVELVGR